MTLREEVQQQIQYASEATLERIKSLLEEYNALLGVHPEETEELSSEEGNAIQEGLTEIENGETVSAQEVSMQLEFA
jgi:predicted transcriptional regulator